MIGTFEDLARIVEVSAEVKMEAHKEKRWLSNEETNKIHGVKSTVESVRVLPQKFLKCIQISYSSKCRYCNHILNSTHLKSHHQLRFSLSELLDQLQVSKLRKSARSNLNDYLRLVTRLAKRKEGLPSGGVAGRGGGSDQQIRLERGDFGL